MVAYSYVAAAAALVQGSVAAHGHGHGHGHARMHIRRDPSTCPKNPTTIQLQPVIVEVLTPILITGHAPGPTTVTIADTVVVIPDCSGDISQVITETGYDTTTLTSTVGCTTFAGPYTTVSGSYGGADTITVTLPPIGGNSVQTVIVHTPESGVTPITQIGDCTTTTVPGWGSSSSSTPGGGSSSTPCTTSSTASSTVASSTSTPCTTSSTASSTVVSSTSTPCTTSKTSSSTVVSSTSKPCTTSKTSSTVASSSSKPCTTSKTSSSTAVSSTSKPCTTSKTSSSTVVSSTSKPCTTSKTSSTVVSSTSKPCTTSKTSSSTVSSTSKPCTTSKTSKSSSSTVVSSTSKPCTKSKTSSTVVSSTSKPCTTSKTSSTSTRCTSSSKTTSKPCTTSHKPTPTPCTKCAHKTQPTQPAKACVTTLPKACQKLNQLDGLALVPAAPICLLSLGLYGVGNAAGCLHRDLMSLNSRGSNMVDCLMVAMRDSCITSLPNACSKLSQHNGMALVPEVAKCALQLGPLAGGGAGNCLSHSNISPSTSGTGLVACLQSNLLGDGSAGF